VCDQPPRSTQPGHPLKLKLKTNLYSAIKSEDSEALKPKGSDALQLGSKGRCGSCVGARQNCVIPFLHTGHI